MKQAYIVTVNGKQLTVADTLEEAKQRAEQHRGAGVELRIRSVQLDPAPKASPTLNVTWSYDYRISGWIVR